MKGIVYVGSDGLTANEQLVRWVDMGLEFVQSLLPKKAAAKNRTEGGVYEDWVPAELIHLAWRSKQNW